jgi:hypothetical protein
MMLKKRPKNKGVEDLRILQELGDPEATIAPSPDSRF